VNGHLIWGESLEDQPQVVREGSSPHDQASGVSKLGSKATLGLDHPPPKVGFHENTNDPLHCLRLELLDNALTFPKGNDAAEACCDRRRLAMSLALGCDTAKGLPRGPIQ
jgi:hypothetical protein